MALSKFYTDWFYSQIAQTNFRHKKHLTHGRLRAFGKAKLKSLNLGLGEGVTAAGTKYSTFW